MESYSLFGTFAQIVGYLAFLVAAAVLVLRISRGRTGLSLNQGRHLKLVETLPLGQNKFLALVSVGKHFLLLGISDTSVSLLKELATDEVQEDTSNARKTHQQAGDSGKRFLQLLKESVSRVTSRKEFMALGLLVIACVFLLRCEVAFAEPASIPIPNVEINLGEGTRGGLSTALSLLGVLTVLSLAPAILILTTSFTRIVTVFSFVRAGLGTQQTPTNQILIGLALLLTFFVMKPTWNQVYTEAIVPYINGQMDAAEALRVGSEPVKAFMIKQTREKDLALFAALRNEGIPASPQELSLVEIVPAFVISELKTAFEIGFMLFLPFLVIDMVVASVLMAMGMLMLPPVLISLPFKLLLFVLVDGWNLITRTLVTSFK